MHEAKKKMQESGIKAHEKQTCMSVRGLEYINVYRIICALIRMQFDAVIYVHEITTFPSA